MYVCITRTAVGGQHRSQNVSLPTCRKDRQHNIAIVVHHWAQLHLELCILLKCAIVKVSVCLSTYGSFLVPDYFSSSSSLPCTCRSLRRAAPRCSDRSVAHLSSLRHDKCRSQLWGHTAREQWCVQIHCRSRPHTCPLSGCSTPLVDMLSAQGVEWWNCCLHTYRKEFRRLQRYISRNEMIKYSQRI